MYIHTYIQFDTNLYSTKNRENESEAPARCTSTAFNIATVQNLITQQCVNGEAHDHVSLTTGVRTSGAAACLTPVVSFAVNSSDK